MAIDLRLPNITAESQSGKMAQIQSYLYQLVGQLNYALSTIEGAESGTTEVISASKTSAASQEEAIDTFNSIKALIIKSAEIVQAYETTMKIDFDGAYTAKTEFGQYAKNTTNSITANSDNITQALKSIDRLSGEVNAIKVTEAYIKTGLLDTTNNIYGVEVGQTDNGTFKRYARFTADGIYFYLPGADNAVAYITNNKLYITNAEVTGSLKVGKYQMDTTDGLAFKYIGDS